MSLRAEQRHVVADAAGHLQDQLAGKDAVGQFQIE